MSLSLKYSFLVCYFCEKGQFWDITSSEAECGTSRVLFISVALIEAIKGKLF